MASIALSKLTLIDHWPGVPNPNLGVPTGGFDATAWNFSTMDITRYADNPPYPPGTKIMAYTDNTECPGWYTMMYLARHEFSAECISSDSSEAVIFVGPCGALEFTHTAWDGVDTSTTAYYMTTSCYSGHVAALTLARNVPVAVVCTTTDADSSITLTTDPRAKGYGHAWGWFWVGGVCPCKDITFLKGLRDSLAGAEITTDTNEVGFLYPCWTTATFLPSSDPSTSNNAGIGAVPFAYACASGA